MAGGPLTAVPRALVEQPAAGQRARSSSIVEPVAAAHPRRRGRPPRPPPPAPTASDQPDVSPSPDQQCTTSLPPTRARRTDSCIVDAGVTARAEPGAIGGVEHRGDEDRRVGSTTPARSLTAWRITTRVPVKRPVCGPVPRATAAGGHRHGLCRGAGARVRRSAPSRDRRTARVVHGVPMAWSDSTPRSRRRSRCRCCLRRSVVQECGRR